MGSGIDLDAVSERLERFAQDRDWNQFHNPKNLVMALAGEVGELAELFQWFTPEESSILGENLPRGSVEDELSDILQYVIRIVDQLDVDLGEALSRKLAENERRYDPNVVRGKAMKLPAGEVNG